MVARPVRDGTNVFCGHSRLELKLLFLAGIEVLLDGAIDVARRSESIPSTTIWIVPSGKVHMSVYEAGSGSTWRQGMHDIMEYVGFASSLFCRRSLTEGGRIDDTTRSVRVRLFRSSPRAFAYLSSPISVSDCYRRNIRPLGIITH